MSLVKIHKVDYFLSKKFKIPTNKYDNKISVALQYRSIKVYEYRQTKYTNKRLF